MGKLFHLFLFSQEFRVLRLQCWSHRHSQETHLQSRLQEQSGLPQTTGRWLPHPGPETTKTCHGSVSHTDPQTQDTIIIIINLRHRGDRQDRILQGGDGQ